MRRDLTGSDSGILEVGKSIFLIIGDELTYMILNWGCQVYLLNIVDFAFGCMVWACVQKIRMAWEVRSSGKNSDAVGVEIIISPCIDFIRMCTLKC